MNERIRELAHEAEKQASQSFHQQWLEGKDTPSLQEHFRSKFAELIVAECLSIVKSNTYGPNGEYDYSYSDESAAADDRAETIYKEIAYRFGVEE